MYFSRGLFFKGLIFRGAYLRREICVSKSIGLALLLEANLPFFLCFIWYLRAIFQVNTQEAHIWKGDITEGFWVTTLGALNLKGLIHGGPYFRNFTVFRKINTNKRKPSMQTLEFQGQTHGLPAEETLPNYICQFKFNPTVPKQIIKLLPSV